MNKLQKIWFLIPMICLIFTSCEWTDIEPLAVDHVGGHNTDGKSEQYYADLRAWKATSENYGRPISFGWFSNWAPVGAGRKGYMTSLPDSVDMISLWSAPFGLSEAKKIDKANFREKKGGKVVVCYILHNIGTGITPAHVAEKVIADNPDASSSELNKLTKVAQDAYWGYTSRVKGSEDHIAAIQKYARVLCDSLIINGYDGLDIDWEPNGAGDGGDDDGSLKGDYGKHLHVLVQEIGKQFGPLSTSPDGKHKYFLIDGELWNVAKESGPYFDYYVTQAYGSYNLDNRVNQGKSAFGEFYDTRKHIFTENFESYSQSGGALLTQAAYNHVDGPKGGVGTFRMDNDYDNVPDYKFTRQSIQIMHDAHKEYMEQNPSNN